MTLLLRGGGALAVALAGTVAIGALSRANYTAERGEGVVRLAWQARGEAVEECRRLTPEELARLPPHMRQEERCEEHGLPYRLRVRLDGASVVDELVRPAGARRDRPLYVYRELVLAPGSHALAVDFTREGALPAGARKDQASTPPQLALDTTVALQARRVLLVTYDDDAQRLVLRDRPP